MGGFPDATDRSSQAAVETTEAALHQLYALGLSSSRRRKGSREVVEGGKRIRTRRRGMHLVEGFVQRALRVASHGCGCGGVAGYCGRRVSVRQSLWRSSIKIHSVPEVGSVESEVG